MAKKKAELPLRLEWRTPEELCDNPLNWRTHPDAQAAGLDGLLTEVGWAGAALFNEATGRLIDGHLRKKVAPARLIDGKMPVLVGSWTEEQEQKILAALDPLAGMAAVDTEALTALLDGMDFGTEGLKAALDKFGEDLGINPPDFQPVSVEDQPRLDEKKPVTCPECGHEFSPS